MDASGVFSLAPPPLCTYDATTNFTRRERGDVDVCARTRVRAESFFLCVFVCVCVCLSFKPTADGNFLVPNSLFSGKWRRARACASGVCSSGACVPTTCGSP